MKTLVPFLLLVLSFIPAQAQRPLVEQFVLGLLDDHEGRKWVKDDPSEAELVDKFHATEAPLVQYLDSLIKLENARTYDKVQVALKKWEKKNCFFCSEFKVMHSKRLAEKINDSYTFKYEKKMGTQQQKIYVGKLKSNLFKTEQEKYSFLAGAYVRYGNRENHLHKIKLDNSKSKFDAILKELKALRCDIVDADVKIEAPFTQHVVFTPSPDLKRYLDKQEKLRVELINRRVKFSKERNQSQKTYDLFSGSN